MQFNSTERLALGALLMGATGIGFAPIFVRLSEVGPSATAFYRLFFALPLLWVASRFETRPGDAAGGDKWGGWRAGVPLKLCALAGCLFAGDLAFWHWSIKLTSVANSTLLTNCAPFVVIIGGRVLFAERITGWLIFGMGLALLGATFLVGSSFQLTASHLLGDLLALTTAGFYGGYLLTIKYLRRSIPTATVMAWSGLVSCALLLLIALLSHESIRPASTRGWTILLALGLISHIGGQGLIAYALAHLPAGFSSVGLLLQPAVAALLARVLLAEGLSGLQIAGGATILLGITVASRGGRDRKRR